MIKGTENTNSSTLHLKADLLPHEELEIDQALEHCLDDIWDNYDHDGNGELDYEEAKQFIKDVLKETGSLKKVKEKDLKMQFNQVDAD